MDYKKYDAESVLQAVEDLIVTGRNKYRMEDVCKELSIFDWWVDYLSQNRLKQMRAFLKKAISLGYRGYVCFKVGAAGCANGMWAHKESSTNGYSPDGECLYRSFTPSYVSWDAKLADNSWVSNHEGEGNLSFYLVKYYIDNRNK